MSSGKGVAVEVVVVDVDLRASDSTVRVLLRSSSGEELGIWQLLPVGEQSVLQLAVELIGLRDG